MSGSTTEPLGIKSETVHCKRKDNMFSGALLEMTFSDIVQMPMEMFAIKFNFA